MEGQPPQMNIKKITLIAEMNTTELDDSSFHVVHSIEQKAEKADTHSVGESDGFHSSVIDQRGH